MKIEDSSESSIELSYDQIAYSDDLVAIHKSFVAIEFHIQHASSVILNSYAMERYDSVAKGTNLAKHMAQCYRDIVASISLVEDAMRVLTQYKLIAKKHEEVRDERLYVLSTYINRDKDIDPLNG